MADQLSLDPPFLGNAWMVHSPQEHSARAAEPRRAVLPVASDGRTSSVRQGRQRDPVFNSDVE